MNTFDRARLKLTAWYLVIITLLLTTSSIAAINAEQRAFNRIEQALFDKVQRPRLTRLLQERLSEFESRFKRRLLILDGVLLISAAAGSYFLSGETLKPIQETLREKEEFAADASHELKTPLTTIGLEIEVIERTQKRLPQEYKDVLLSIKEETAKMRKIVDGLLILYRTQGEEVKDKKTLDLSELIPNTLAQMDKVAKEKKIKLAFKKEKVNVKGDESQIKQVLLILIDNAIKYTPEGGRVTITTGNKGRRVFLSVSDTGYGIDQRDLGHIFERFYRVDNPKLQSQKGAGLGLSIAKKIVESWGGKITAESSLGQGSTFTVKFPSTS